MASVSVQVEGLREVVRDLERAGTEVADLKEVFGRIASEAADEGQRHTPRRSGRLAATARGNKAKNKAVVTWGTARVPYAGAILWGWGSKAANYKHGRSSSGIKGSRRGAQTIPKTDAAMATRAPALLEQGLGDIFTRHGFS